MRKQDALARVTARLALEEAARRAEPPRVFLVSFSGQVLCLQASPGVSQAYDLMVTDGVPPQTAAAMATAAERAGKDPVAAARHFVRLRRSLRACR